MSTMEGIRGFLGQKRLAIVGVSQKPQDFSRTLFREFRDRGYEVVPVNPAVGEIEGRPCYRRVQDIQPPVEAALLMTPARATLEVVHDCAEAGVRHVWMYRAAGAGAVDDVAVAFCEAKGIEVVPGECPFMFLPGAAWYHRMHGWVRTILGAHPK